MPTFYEGEPIAVVHQTLTAEEYAQAAVFAESHRSVWSRSGGRAAIANPARQPSRVLEASGIERKIHVTGGSIR